MIMVAVKSAEAQAALSTGHSAFSVFVVFVHEHELRVEGVRNLPEGPSLVDEPSRPFCLMV
jgi:hypothetical protein